MFSFRLTGRSQRPPSVTPKSCEMLLPNFRCILVPAAGATFSQRSIKTACRLAGSTGEVRLVYLIEVPRAFSLAASLPGEEAQAATVLSEGAKMAQSFGCNASTEVQRGRDVTETLIKYIELQGVDLLVLGARPDGVRGLSKELAKDLYDRAPCQVVLDYIAGNRAPLIERNIEVDDALVEP